MSHSTAQLHRYVSQLVADRLGRPVGAQERLLDQAGFDSLAIADVVDRIEADLDIELAPDLLVPETFADVSSLVGAVAASELALPTPTRTDRATGEPT